MDNSIDIVIPSFRVDEAILLNIIHLKKPDDFIVNIFLVIDNPALEVPGSIRELASQGIVHLIINPVNLGFSATRNKGIRLGSGKWVLLLDDDIVPDTCLLTAYAKACIQNPDAIGFVGCTCFPAPFNNATKALEINGSTGQFKAAATQDRLMWAPTANIMLNREKMSPGLFNVGLKKGGEDIELLVRTALENDDRYVTVPDAKVTHPWWNNGKIQFARMYRYGEGAAQIADLPAIKKYTYYDFTNTSETLLLLLVLAPFCMLLKGFFYVILCAAFAVVLSELVTNCIKAVYLSGSASLVLGVHLFIIKNAYELGALCQTVARGNIKGFAKRIDMSFRKQNPSWFRLNKWKIIKMALIALLLFLLL